MHRPATPYGDEHNVTLSPPAPREEVHNRRISCNGFVREDGQYDIEAEITDNKTYSFPSEFRGDVTPDQFVHHMKVRVTIDRSMTVTAAEAITISGPYAICPTANDVFQNLVGLTIGPGWRRRVTAAIGGRHGCTHISELMGTVGTIAFQTRYGEDARRARVPVGSSGLETTRARGDARGSALANSCVAYAIDD
ncbi:MAG: DUF2889 domain-containing protein [SAR116 cluster bacterium]|jgi:hypothetical protein|nr:MAG: DUF2889 domain-containing protein [SAR116 cluster bacterium]|tara:strand:- start:12978 stop:13559 length:582 start_codon:yes stop_codon:yes gene_type:complete